jgi:hypothetical protein
VHPDLLDGVRLFDEGAYWHAHEAWEAVWVTLPKGSAERILFQALILFAAAFLHRERARTAPERSIRAALRCYRSGMDKLQALPVDMLGLDVAGLRRTVDACFAPLETGAPESEWPPAPRLGPA